MQPHVFAGLKVLDVATVIAGPAAAMMLADFGADVIKIEEPGTGDMLRMISTIPTTPPDAPSNYMLQMDGRNKRSLTLNLKTPEGQAVLRRLVAACDVFITNQPHSVRRSLKLNYADLEPLNPRMIYASLTAYGEDGPERERKGFDQLAYWARSGLMDLMRQPGTRPSQGLPGMGDHPTAVSIYAGIVTALLQREKTGEGAHVTTSLLANGLWSAACIVQGAMAGGDMPKFREINLAHTMIMRPYQASDGRWLQFNMVRSEELLALMFAGLDALHLLADERFATAELMMANRKVLGDLIQEVIAQKSSDEWLATFAELGVPVNRAARVEEAVTDPQVLLNGMAEPAADTLGMPLLVKHPLRISSAPPVRPVRAPELGEHSAEILQEIGYTAEQIAAMRARGAI